jgi:hypothetical protein
VVKNPSICKHDDDTLILVVTLIVARSGVGLLLVAKIDGTVLVIGNNLDFLTLLFGFEPSCFPLWV